MSSTPKATPTPATEERRTETITRTTRLGTTFQIKVEHLGDGNVKILNWRRKRTDDNKFTTVKDEEGRTYPLHQLLGVEPDTTNNEASQPAA